MPHRWSTVLTNSRRGGLTVRADGRDASFDVVRAVLDLVAEVVPGVPAAALLAVELEARLRYGGRRSHIAKTMAADRRQARSRARPLLR